MKKGLACVSMTKKIVSYIANSVFRLFFRAPVRDMVCTLRVYRKDAIKDVVIRGRLHRYFPILLHMSGIKVTEIEVRWTPRQHGESKYGIVDRLLPTINDLFLLLFNRKKVLENENREYRIKERW